MASSSSHTDPFHPRPAGRIPSDSSSGSSSSYQHNTHRGWSQHPADMPEPFTPEMRDLQARGKDPYPPQVADGGDLGGGGRGNMHHGGMRMGSGGGGGRGSNNAAGGGRVSGQQTKEPLQKTERRDWAETVLDNPELLLMYAQSSGDTLPATRHKFKKIMCGLDEYDDDDASTAGGNGGQYHQQPQQHRFNGVSWSNHSGDGGGSRGGRR